MNAADGAEHNENEEQTRGVKGAHELCKRQQRCDAVLANGERHCAECTDRRNAHDHADDLEKNLGALFDEIEDERTAAAELMQRKTEKD